VKGGSVSQGPACLVKLGCVELLTGAHAVVLCCCTPPTFLQERNKVQRVLTEERILSTVDHPFLPTLYCTIQVCEVTTLVMRAACFTYMIVHHVFGHCHLNLEQCASPSTLVWAAAQHTVMQVV
jgi:hypothetical protein